MTDKTIEISQVVPDTADDKNMEIEITQNGDNNTVIINQDSDSESETTERTLEQPNTIVNVQVDIHQYAECDDLDISYAKFKKYVLELYDFLNEELKDAKISIGNITYYLAKIMGKVQEFAELKGLNRKQLVNIVLRTYIKYQVDDQEEENRLLDFCDNVLSGVIDTIISVDKHELVIDVIDNVTNCCTVWKYIRFPRKNPCKMCKIPKMCKVPKMCKIPKMRKN